MSVPYAKDPVTNDLVRRLFGDEIVPYATDPVTQVRRPLSNDEWRYVSPDTGMWTAAKPGEPVPTDTRVSDPYGVLTEFSVGAPADVSDIESEVDITPPSVSLPPLSISIPVPDSVKIATQQTALAVERHPFIAVGGILTAVAVAIGSVVTWARNRKSRRRRRGR